MLPRRSGNAYSILSRTEPAVISLVGSTVDVPGGRLTHVSGRPCSIDSVLEVLTSGCYGSVHWGIRDPSAGSNRDGFPEVVETLGCAGGYVRRAMSLCHRRLIESRRGGLSSARSRGRLTRPCGGQHCQCTTKKPDSAHRGCHTRDCDLVAGCRPCQRFAPLRVCGMAAEPE